MIVCLCKSVSDRQIKACVDAGANSLEELQMDLGVALCCGKCEGYVREMLDGSTYTRTACACACANTCACVGRALAEPRETEAAFLAAA